MKYLELRGVMVDGVLPPDSKEREWLTGCTELAKAITDTDDDLTLTINSYGGSVAGGIEITCALHDWMARKPYRLNIQLEGICASSAANILARIPAGATVTAHPESMIMYHSCNALVEGSPDQLRDNANRMDKYNAVIIASLLQRTSLDPAAVETWFESGREGWLTGLDALKCGLVDELTEDLISPAPLMPPREEGTDQGWQYAAIAAIATKYKEQAMAIDKKIIEKEVEIENPEPEKVETLEPVPAEEEIKTEEEIKAEDETRIEVKEDDELAALRAENEELKKELEALKATCDKLTAGLKAKPQPPAPRKDFAQLVKEIPTDLTPRQYAQRFTALKQEHKAEYDAYMQAHK